MRTGTIVSLGASAVLGIGALVVARVWLAQPAHPPGAAQPSLMTNTVPVVVASTAIPYGAKLDAAHLTIERLPAGDAPQGAYSTTAQILSQTGGPPVALTSFTAREPLLPSEISGPGARPSVSAAISDGMRAYTVAINDTAGVGGHVLPGDHVDVILSRDIPIVNIPNAPSCNCKRVRADVVLQNVKVLGIDLNADPTSSTAAVGHTATLEVSMLDAQKLAVAAQSGGSLSLALRKLGSTELTLVRTVEIPDLKSVGPRAPGPAIPDEKQELMDIVHHYLPNAGKSGATRAVIIVHGDDSKSVEVPKERYGAGA
jgi:pilus assembly protein CpaB